MVALTRGGDGWRIRAAPGFGANLSSMLLDIIGMTEVENPSFYKHLEFDLPALRLDLFRLLYYFVGSSKIHKLAEDKYIEGSDKEIILQSFRALEDECFQKEAGRILLQSAVFTRLVLDESEADPEDRPMHPCGVLEQSGKSNLLSLREACNKIVHSTKINFDRLTDDGHYEPFVYLYGATQKGKEWKATLHIVPFVGYATSILRFRTISDFLEHENQRGNI